MLQTEIFNAAVKLPSGERVAFLERACGSNRHLRDEVESLLQAHDAPDSFLREPVEKTTAYEPIAEQSGAVVGAYKLLERIGEGGFGVVFLAEQTHPVRRKVALKILKPGMDSRAVVARFEAERQALALMDHPHIARVFDGGVTASGRPYFVMELVRGVPITDFCDRNQLAPRERLELFVQVCAAVQHAHQKGIIHRDLKPSNVLVSRHDTTPVVKVIDFGVAKALGQTLTDKTLFTGLAQMVGTPLYMSPEQAGMSDLDVDTRGDVYSLGVLLYELLTGTTPFIADRFKKAGYDEIRRIIREEEPPKPSTRLSESKDTLPSVAAQRQTEPAKLTKLVRGELDWIVMKSLEKDRNRRYETANGFAADVQRHLAGEAVLAVPPSAVYRFRMFARRNKRALVTAVVIGVALLMAVGSIGWVVRDRAAGRVRTTTEVNQFLQRAEVLYADNKLPEAVAEVQKARGVHEAGHGDEDLDRRVDRWLTDLDTAARLEELRLAVHDREEPGRVLADYDRVFRDYSIDAGGPTEDVTARIAASQIKLDLVLALRAWATQVQFNPRSPGRVREQRLRELARAADPDPWWLRYVAALEAKDLHTLRELANGANPGQFRTGILASLGDSLRVAGDAEGAVTFLRRVQRLYPGDFLINSALASCLERLKEPALDDAIAFRRAALAVRPQSAWAHFALAYALSRKGHSEEAVGEYREAIRLRPQFAWAYSDMGLTLWEDQKKPDEALAAYAKAIELDPKCVPAHTNIGLLKQKQGKLDEAIHWSRRALDLDPQDAYAHNTLGLAYHDQKKLNNAIPCYLKAIEIDPKFANAHCNLGNARSDQNKYEEAVACYLKALEIDPKHRNAHGCLGNVFYRQRKYDEAVDWYRKAVAIDSNYSEALYGLGVALKALGNHDQAIPHLRSAIELDARYENARNALVGSLMAKGWRLVNNPDPKLRDPKQAVAVMKEATELAPQSILGLQYSGWIHYRLGNWRASVEALEKSCKLQEGGTGDSYQWIVLALAHARLAADEGLPDEERVRHRAESRRWYEPSAKDLDSRKWTTRPSGGLDQAAWDFRQEALQLIGPKEEK